MIQIPDSTWESDPNEVAGVAVQLRRTAPAQLHVGLAFRDTSGVLRTLELQWHHKVACDPSMVDGVFGSVQLDATNALVVAGFCEAVALENADEASAIPYWIAYNGETFDSTGRWLHETGLTCATFVLAVLRSLAFEVADFASWQPRVEDSTWQCSILRILASRHRADAERQSGLTGGARLRPEEVAAAAALPASHQPAGFTIASSLGVALRERLGADPLDRCELSSTTCMLRPR